MVRLAFNPFHSLKRAGNVVIMKPNISVEVEVVEGLP